MPKGSLPKRALVWNHFTHLSDDDGKSVDKAKCNYCDKVLSAKDGTNSMIQHFLNHFTRRLDKDTSQCNFCQDKFKASVTVRSQMLKHVDECKKKGSAAVGPSRPPAVQTHAPSGFGSSSMDLELELADDLGAQPPPLPSAPSQSGGSSSDGVEEVPDMDEPSKRLAQMIVFHGFDPSIVENDGFKSFVESLNPEYRVPKRVEIEDACDHIFIEEALGVNYCNGTNGRISLAVGKAKIMEREVVYTSYHFIDDEWNLRKEISAVYLDGPFPYHLGNLDDRIKQICVETHLVEVVSRICDRMKSTYLNDIFMMAWRITKEHSILKGSINQNFSNTSAVKRRQVCTTFMDVTFHSVAEHLYLQIDAKFREDMHSICVSSARQKQEEILSHVGVDLWAYKEAWYSWYCFLVVLRNEDQEADSELTRLLRNIWGGIYRAIKTISMPKLPGSNLCLLEMFNVKKILESELAVLASGGRTIYHRGRTAFIEGKDVTTVLNEVIEILDKAIQESYLVWSIPLVLDPRYNLAGMEEAFRGAFGEAAAGSYISKSIEHIKLLYSEYVERELEFMQFKKKELEFMRLLEPAAAQAELDLYLNFRVVHPTKGFDILNWWRVHGSRQYPMVAGMARDALAMPTSSQLSSRQIAHVKSKLRGYSKFELDDEFEY